MGADLSALQVVRLNTGETEWVLQGARAHLAGNTGDVVAVPRVDDASRVGARLVETIAPCSFKSAEPTRALRRPGWDVHEGIRAADELVLTHVF